ncbi:MAG TPA: hypothetical protein VEP73_03080, partial [Actinomycetota bacterium]|nr:hypothetical protein [Actinomycetota bacterium]
MNLLVQAGLLGDAPLQCDERRRLLWAQAAEQLGLELGDQGLGLGVQRPAGRQQMHTEAEAL